MKRVLGAITVALVALSGCTDTANQSEPSSLGTSAQIGDYEEIELSELCADLIEEPLQNLADTYGFTVYVDSSESDCHGQLQLIDDDGSVAGVNGMSVYPDADRFETETEAATAFAIWTDPENSNFSLTLPSGIFTPEDVDNVGWDGFRIVVADSDAPNQELRAMLLRGTIVVRLWITIDQQRSFTEECSPDSQSTSCAMSLDLADEWVRTELADHLVQVVSGLDQ